ncbi:unnamed protein product [Symbiodinium sp. CCMP2456]|nr:unnamed protein product [Symbiodinium sp. CCMP2456]
MRAHWHDVVVLKRWQTAAVLGQNVALFPDWPPADWLPEAKFAEPSSSHQELSGETVSHLVRSIVSWAPVIQERALLEVQPEQDLEADEPGEIGDGRSFGDVLAGMARVAVTLKGWGAELAGTLPVASGRGRAMHDVTKILKYLRCSWYAGSTHQLDLVMHHAVTAALPPQLAAGVLQVLKSPQRNPSKWSLKRYRLALDIAYLYVSQEENLHANSRGGVRFLWADSSPDRYHNWLWTEQHHIADADSILACFDAAATIVQWLNTAGVQPLNVSEHNRSCLRQLLNGVCHHIHTPSALGSGKGLTDMAHKAAAMVHSLSLENPDWGQLLPYLSSFVSITTDMGVESTLANFRVSLRHLFPAWRDLDPLEADADDERPAQLNVDISRFFLENALPVMGMQHCVYNLLKEIHTAIPFWDVFWRDLKNLEALLNWRFRRQRYISTCLRGTPLADLESQFESFSQSLYESRWHEVASFTKKLEPLLAALRSTWNERRFQGSDGMDEDGGPQSAPAGAAAFNPQALTRCLSSALFASRVRMVIKLEAFPEMLAGWAEDCPCHGGVTSESSQYQRSKLMQSHYEGFSVCPMSGKRAPELASGKISEVYDAVSRQALVSVLMEAPLLLSPEEQARVISDFGHARDHIKVLLMSKLDHWTRLPWSLCGLAAYDAETVRRNAQGIITAFEESPDVDLHHRLTCKFMSGQLLEDLRRLAEGAGMQTLTREFRLAVAALRFVPVVETTIESKHAVTSRLHRRDTNAGNRARAFLQKPLTSALYRTDVEAQFQPMGAARKGHEDYHRRNKQVVQGKLESGSVGQSGAQPRPRQAGPYERLRGGMILEHFRVVASSREDGRATLFSLPAGSSGVVQSASSFFAGAVDAASAERRLRAVDAEPLDADHGEAPELEVPPLFFSVVKSRPSANKRMFVNPGAGRSLESHHVAVALHRGLPARSGGFEVRFQDPGRTLDDDNIAILSSLGSSCNEIESSLKRWSVEEELSYALPGQFSNSRAVTDMVTAMVKGKYTADNDFYVPPIDVHDVLEPLCQQGFLVSNGLSGYALTQKAMGSLLMHWKASDPAPVCAVRDGVDVWEMTVFELALKLEDIFAKGIHGQIPHGKDRRVYEAILAGEPVDYARGPRGKRALLDVDGEVSLKPKQKRASGRAGRAAPHPGQLADAPRAALEGPEGPAGDSSDAAGSANDRVNEIEDDEDVDDVAGGDLEFLEDEGFADLELDDLELDDQVRENWMDDMDPDDYSPSVPADGVDDAEEVVPEAHAAESVPADGAAEPRVPERHAERERVVRSVPNMLHSSRFGCFSLIPKQPGSAGTGPFGGFQGSCPYHKKSSKTGCKKFVSIKGPRPEDKDLAMREILFWCTQARSCRLQREHLCVPLKPTPAMEVLLARVIEDPPSAPVLTDEDLDRRDGRANQPKRAAKRAAKSKAAARESGPADASRASSSSDGESDSGPEMQRHSAKRKSVASAGPDTYAEIIGWPSRVLSDMRVHQPQMVTSLQSKFQKRIVVTTHYSGLGTAELALRMLERQFASHVAEGEPSSGIVLYSACEKDPTARSMLLNHTAEAFNPQHVFGDILSRVPAEQLCVLKDIESDFLHRSEQLCKDAQLSTVDRSDLKDSLGAEMMEMFLHKLDQCTFSERDWCYVHKRRCPLCPVREPDAEYGEIAGTTCVAWSSMRQANSSSGKWLHRSTLPCLVWLFWLQKVQPSWYLHECVVRFDASALIQRLSQYLTLSFVFSPVDFGIPVHRQRRYTFGINLESHTLSDVLVQTMGEKLCGFRSPSSKPYDWSVDDDKQHRESVQMSLWTVFKQMFFHDVTAGCDVFLQAPRSMVQKYIEGLADAKGISRQSSSDGHGLDVTAVLSGAHFQRLVGYRALVRESGSTEGWYVMDLEQTSGFKGRITSIVPCLLRNSTLCMLQATGSVEGASGAFPPLPTSSTRLVMPVEVFALQGFPLVLRSDLCQKWAEFFPWSIDWIIRSFSGKEILQLAGNGMHLQAVGTMLALVLSLAQKRKSISSSNLDSEKEGSVHGLRQVFERKLMANLRYCRDDKMITDRLYKAAKAQDRTEWLSEQLSSMESTQRLVAAYKLRFPQWKSERADNKRFLTQYVEMVQAETAILYEGDGVMLTEDKFVMHMAKAENGGMSGQKARVEFARLVQDPTTVKDKKHGLDRVRVDLEDHLLAPSLEPSRLQKLAKQRAPQRERDDDKKAPKISLA